MSTLKKERLEKFVRVVQEIKGSVCILVTQVDPDAVGSAMGLKAVLEHVLPGTEVTIAYCGTVSHPQNRTIFNRCDLFRTFVPFADIVGTAFGAVMLVDSSETKDGRLPAGAATLDPTVVIDHHRGLLGAEGDKRFFWIEDIGACSTLITELLQSTGTPLDQGHLPILLAMGIYTDTKALIAASTRDHEAYGFVSKDVVPADFKHMLSYTLPLKYIDLLAHALLNRHQKGGRLIVNAGSMSAEDGDVLAIIADELLRVESVNLVAVWAIMDKIVRISFRTSDLTLNLDSWLKTKFGPDMAGAKLTPDARGEGGARISIDLGDWYSLGCLAEIEALVSKRLKEKIFQD